MAIPTGLLRMAEGYIGKLDPDAIATLLAENLPSLTNEQFQILHGAISQETTRRNNLRRASAAAVPASQPSGVAVDVWKAHRNGAGGVG